jgi:hypothetical protein
MPFAVLDTVRIARLHDPVRDVTSALDPAPQPRIGQLATVVDDVGDDVYLVERTTDDGVSAWLAEFAADELELVARADAAD